MSPCRAALNFQRRVSRDRRQPRAPAAARGVKLRDLVPHAQRRLREALLAVERVRHDRRDDVAHQRPAVQQQRIHAALVMLLQQRDHILFVHALASSRRDRFLPYDTRAARKTHAVFHNFSSKCAKRRRFAECTKRRMADKKTS